MPDSPSPAKKPAAKKKKAKSPTKKAVKADYGGVYFGAEEPTTSREQEDEEQPEELEDDPMATYRAAAAAAKEAAAKEAKEDARDALYKKLFHGMDIDGDGKVDMGEVIERIAAASAPLSHRAQSSRPEGSVALQLPMVFGYKEWIKEMKRVSKLMDHATFESNVLAMFECFDGAAAEPAQPKPVSRTELLTQVFAAMDVDGNGLVDEAEFLRTAKTPEEAEALPALFAHLNASPDGRMTLEEWVQGMNDVRPDDGRPETDAAFGREMRMILQTLDDTKAKETAAKSVARMQSDAGGRLMRKKALKQVFDAMDTDNDGRIDLNDFLMQNTGINGAADDEATNELTTLFQFFGSFDGDGTPRESSSGKGFLTFEQFAHGTLTRTPLGRVRTDKMFESAVRGMMADIASTQARRAGKVPSLPLQVS